LWAELGDSIEGWRADIGDIGHHRRSEAVPPEQSEALRVRQGAGVAQKAGRGGGVLVPAMELLRRPEKEGGGGVIAGMGEGYGGSELDLRRASGEAGEARSSKALRAVCEALGRSHARAWRSRRRKSVSDLRWPTAMTAPQVWRKPRSSSRIVRGMS
jgi:hypothetical protein